MASCAASSVCTADAGAGRRVARLCAHVVGNGSTVEESTTGAVTCCLPEVDCPGSSSSSSTSGSVTAASSGEEAGVLARYKCSATIRRSSERPINVLLTGAAGSIAYSLIFMIGQGRMFGTRMIKLHLLDIKPSSARLQSVVMELEDSSLPYLAEVVATTEYSVAFRNVDVALLVGARPRGKGMKRQDLLLANAAIFEGQGRALEQYASKDVKVLVVGNPANTNAFITMRNAPSIPRRNFTALTRLDQNRAKAQLAARAKVKPERIKNVIIWGNHSATQFPDARFAVIERSDGSGVQDGVSSVVDQAWLRSGFVSAVQQRGAKVIKMRGLSSAASAANAICDHVRDWCYGSQGEIISMGVCTAKEHGYGLQAGLIFSLPVICEGRWKYSIVKELPLLNSSDSFVKAAVEATHSELQHESQVASKRAS